MPATSEVEDDEEEEADAADAVFATMIEVFPSSAGDGVSSPASRRRVPVLSAPIRADTDEAADDEEDGDDDEEEEDERRAAAWRRRARSGKKSRSTMCSSTAV